MLDRFTIHGMKGSDFDLNHARALHHLLEEAHVTRAARQLGITPAAASNALRRLRADFGDPLLVRSGRALTRTPRAEELRGPAREMMLAAERLFQRGRPFDPATAAWEIVLTTSDRMAELLLPTLDRLLTERAPSARLNVRTMTTDIAAFLRARGGIAIVPEVMKESELRSEPLFVEDLVCVLRNAHPLTTQRWSLKRFAELEHVLVAPLGVSQRSSIDTLLAQHQLTRRVSRVVSSFALALPLIAHSDRVALLPRSIAVTAHAKASKLAIRALPIEMPPIEMSLAWHLSSEGDPKQVWLRRVLHDAAHLAGLTGSDRELRGRRG